ncbi:hypothetical protein [Actinosynnema sp. NPDC020468]|uniref:hypothetical protein n=1 Tax=Actinosynnema sp. NPDC020468 TaxID=3154488 RepID=UPI0033C8C5C3
MSKARIAELRSDADLAVDAIDNQRLRDDPTVLSRRDAARDAAVKVRAIAREPITIGVVGEFSAGKSLLIGTLLGKPDLLPVAGQPVTGNITALVLAPGTGATTETGHSVTIEYLSRDRLVGAADHMVRRLAQAAANVPGLDTAPLEAVDAAQPAFFARVEAWCRQLWAPGGEREKNPEVLHAAWELMRLNETVRNAESLIGQQVDVDVAYAEAALELGDRRPIPTEFPAPRGRVVTRDSIRQSTEDLRSTFSLIHRVVHEVRVPPGVWDLSMLRDENQVMLLDFPGLNSDASHNRDEYLSISELENVSTIMIVLAGDNPGAKGPTRFYGMMQGAGRDRAALAQAILVAGNKFDRVPAPQVLSGARVDVDVLSALSEDLRGFRTAVRDLTDHAVLRCQLTSAAAGMAHYGLRYDAGSAETRAKIDEARSHAPEDTSRWGELGLRIEQHSPGDPWAAQLRALGADGGIAALRALIEHHAREHGLRLKTEVLERHHRAMVTAVERFARVVDPPGGASASARADAERLSAFLRSVATSVADARARVSVFTAPDVLVADTAVLHHDPGQYLAEAVRAEVVRRVYQWPNWQNIISRADDHVVRRRPRSERPTSITLPRLGKATSKDTDTTSELYEQFQSVVVEIQGVARQAVRDVAMRWVTDRNEERDALRDAFADPDLRDSLERALDVMASDAVVREGNLAAVQYALSFDLLSPQLEELVDGVLPDVDPRDRFPLPVPHFLPWHPGMPVDRERFADLFLRHQQNVFRIRRAVANATADVVAEHLARALAVVASATGEYLELVEGELPDADKVPVTPTGDDPDAITAESPVRALLADWRTRA